jgi:cobaltochelatase CobS
MKIKNRETGEVKSFASLDTALRTLTGKNGEPLLTKPGRKTYAQGVALLNSGGYDVESMDTQIPYFAEPKKEEPAPKEASDDVMKKFATLLAEMVNVESKVNEAVSERLGLQDQLVDEKIAKLFEDVKSITDNQKPKEIVVLPNAGAPKNLGVQHKNFEDLLIAVSQRINALLVGRAGSGKTYGAEMAAKACGIPYYSISVGAQTTKSEFFGYPTATGTVFRTSFREAFEFGGLFLLDELDAGNSNVLLSINQALANGYCAFPDGMVKKHPDFVVVGTANTWGFGGSREYVGRNPLDAATLDRFVDIEWDYDMKLEESLSSNPEWLKECRRVRDIITEKKIRHVVSPRAILHGQKLIAAGMEFGRVKELVLLKGMNETEKMMCK